MSACSARLAWLSLAHAAPAALPVWAALKRRDPCVRSLGERLAATLGGDDDAFADLRHDVDHGRTDGSAGGPPNRLPARLRSRLRSAEIAHQVERALAREARHAHHHLITPPDAAYPPRLAAIDDPPPMLALTGRLAALAPPGVAIVGARRASVAGLDTARALAEELASLGLSILSGLALGIDAAAHRGALNVDGISVAVLATGPERIYPPRHAELAERLCERGALVTEFPAGSRLRPQHFTIRNRLGSALSCGVVLIEAAERSGTLSTATHARRQNREVMVVPGGRGDARSRGGDDLLRDGATPVDGAADVVAAVAPGLRHELDAMNRTGALPVAPDDPDATRLLGELSGRETTARALCATTRWPIGRMMAALGLLELHGCAQRGSDGGYSLCLTAPQGPVAGTGQVVARGSDRVPNAAGLDAHPVFDLD